MQAHKKAMFSKLGGLASPSGFLSPSPLAFSLESCIRVPLSVYPLSFLLLTWYAFPRNGNVCFTFPVPCWAIPLGCWQCLFTFPLYVISLCMMYVYLYMLVYGWLCTLYDGPSWLGEQPSLAISALDLIMLVCAQGNCCRCIFMLYCMHNHQVILVSPCMQHTSICLILWEALAHPSISMLAHARHETQLICHSTPNAKLCWIFTVKIGHPHCRILMVKAWWG